MRRSLLILLIVFVGITTLSPLSSVAQNCSDDAELVEQSLAPAAELLAPDASFTVAWTLRNSGDCTWDRTYRLIYVKGERMDSPRTLRLRTTVEPGETMTLSLELTAPSDVDSYIGTWRLRNPDGDTFGPELTLQIRVGEASTSEVVLPEVLVFGGMGGGGGPEDLVYCVENDALFSVPTMVVGEEDLLFRHSTIYLCGLPEGAEITIEVIDPEGNSFTHSDVQHAAVTSYDEDGNEEFTGTVLRIDLVWLNQAMVGDWWVAVTSGEFSDWTIISVAEPLPPSDEEIHLRLDNWPTGPIDPLIAAASCHYRYLPSQEMMIGGRYLPPNTTWQLGIYQDRLSSSYLVDQVTVQSDSQGDFTIPYVASSEPGSYTILILRTIDPEGYFEDGVQYMPNSMGDEETYTCFDVALASEPEIHWRLAFASGDVGLADIQVLTLDEGWSSYHTAYYGDCDASEPAWWPGAKWVIYQTNCVEYDNGEFVETLLGTSYDLYASAVDAPYDAPAEEKRVQLTATPDLHETEPDANGDGLIVYRQLPAGTSLDSSGELRLLNNFENTDTSLGLYGRAPTWSPDGTRIAFMSDIEGSWQIYVYDVQDEMLWRVSQGCATHCQLPAWSPDGEQIVYQQSVTLDDLTSTGLWIATADGTHQPRSYLVGEYGSATWSSQGWIAFQGPGGIYRATPERRPMAERYLYADPQWQHFASPVWSH